MDELQWALLGSVGGHFLLQSDGREVIVLPSVQQKMHPGELSLLHQLLPVSPLYVDLRSFVERAQVGSYTNIYLSSVALAVEEVLTEYESKVLSMRHEMDAIHLLRYVPAFTQLRGIVESMIEAGTQSSGSTCPMNYLDLPCPIPLGMATSMIRQCLRIVLLHTAHWMANGVLLSDSSYDGFFLTMEDSRVVLKASQIPRWISTDLASQILLTGNHRAALGALVAPEEAVTVANEVANLDGMCTDGTINTHELRGRVDKVGAMWSHRMWDHIVDSSRCGLRELAERLRSFYLCSQGDMWLRFVHDSASIILDVAAVTTSTLEVETYPRTLQSVFARCTSYMGDRDDWMVPRISLQSDGFDFQTSRSAEQAAQCILRRISSLKLKCTLTAPNNSKAPTCSPELVVDMVAMKLYDDLFQLHLRGRYTHEALHCCHRLLLGWTKRTGAPALEASRVLLYVLHSMLFFVDNLMYYLQVDVQDSVYQDFGRRTEVTDVEDAKHAHDGLLRQLVEKCYLTDVYKDVGSDLQQALCMCLTLYVLCARVSSNESTTTMEEMTMGCESLFQKFMAVMLNLHTKLVNMHRPEAQALLCRLDFNKWLSLRAHSAQH